MNRAVEPFLRLQDAANGHVPAKILHVAVNLDLFSKLSNEGKTAAQLATLVHADPTALELLLNALAAMGYLKKEKERFYSQPIIHTYLVKNGPKYLGHLIAHQARSWEQWSHLESALLSGKPVHRNDMYQDQPAALNDFIRGMHELAIARGDARYLSKAIPLGRCRKLLDLGGGPGTYASMFCRANRSLRAVVMDLPATLKVTRRILKEFDQTGRVSTMSGDYRKPGKIKGAPYDVVLISNILHAEDEATNRRLLQRVHDAMTPGGIVIIKDHILNPDHTSPINGALFALEMRLGTSGRTYSYREVASWLQESGYQDMVEVPIGPPMNISLVLALRPGKKPLAVLPRPVARMDPASNGGHTSADKTSL